jgi:Negative regulator of sigma F
VSETLEREEKAALRDSERPVDEVPAPPLSPLLLAALAETRPVKTRRPLRTAAGIGLVSVAGGLSVLFWGLRLREDLAEIPPVPLLLYCAAGFVSFGAQLAAALIPPRGEVLPAGARSSSLPLVSLATAVPLGVLFGMRAHPGLPWSFGDLTMVWQHVLPCLLDGLLVAAGPALLGMLALRRLVPPGSWREAFAVGGACGVLAGLILQLHCPRADLVHLALAHGSVMVVPALVLAVLGIRLLAR